MPQIKLKVTDLGRVYKSLHRVGTVVPERVKKLVPKVVRKAADKMRKEPKPTPHYERTHEYQGGVQVETPAPMQAVLEWSAIDRDRRVPSQYAPYVGGDAEGKRQQWPDWKLGSEAMDEAVQDLIEQAEGEISTALKKEGF